MSKEFKTLFEYLKNLRLRYFYALSAFYVYEGLLELSALNIFGQKGAEQNIKTMRYGIKKIAAGEKRSGEKRAPLEIVFLTGRGRAPKEKFRFPTGPARAFSFGSAARRAAINRDFVQNEF